MDNKQENKTNKRKRTHNGEGEEGAREGSVKEEEQEQTGQGSEKQNGHHRTDGDQDQDEDEYEGEDEDDGMQGVEAVLKAIGEDDGDQDETEDEAKAKAEEGVKPETETDTKSTPSPSPTPTPTSTSTQIDAMNVLKADIDQYKAAVPSKEDKLQYDLGNLTGYDSTPLDQSALGRNPRQYLLELSRDNTQLLLNRIFSLPTTPCPDDVGVLATLPRPTTPLPREKPVPEARVLTKWEQFAKLKGIHKKKRERMVYDELSNEYKPRWGYQRANNPMDQWLVEAKAGDDLTKDPWSVMKEEKQKRVEKNRKNKMRNLKKASGARPPGTIDLTTALPPNKKRRKEANANEKHHVDVALAIAQRSTASLGRFDQRRHNEPQFKPLSTAEKRNPGRPVRMENKENADLLKKMFKNTEPRNNFDSERAAKMIKQIEDTKRSLKPKGRFAKDGDTQFQSKSEKHAKNKSKKMKQKHHTKA